MSGCRDVYKKLLKCPRNGGFPPFVTPQDFFSKIALCHFCTLMVLQLHAKKLEKTMKGLYHMRYLETDQHTTDEWMEDKGDY